ncbi:DUF2933 domain-containing protein [Teredinibacter turnerae]|uniref:DUF2933 domain-containing protein n=1 Tax=Teredinibacter turnerae TaxID=2426 RepID=UPI000368FD97|nr:DUF2933 domain-containing protein [Teredinibacter turnerae]
MNTNKTPLCTSYKTWLLIAAVAIVSYFFFTGRLAQLGQLLPYLILLLCPLMHLFMHHGHHHHDQEKTPDRKSRDFRA